MNNRKLLYSGFSGKNLRLDCEFFERDTAQVAQDLLGMKLVHHTEYGLVSGIIVETEAYTADDEACHAYRGKTERNKALFGPVGHAYVYKSYGLHYCFNIVARSSEQAAGGVLIRALQPVDGIEIMQQLRSVTKKELLTSGPGNVTKAMNITMKHYGNNMLNTSGLFIEPGIIINPATIVATPRIGISKATDKLWRFVINNKKRRLF